jgi:excisionase family DNA binding protein
MNERLINVPEVARLLDVERSWVYQACDRGVLPFRRVGRYLKFVPSEVEIWLERQRGGPRDVLEASAK